MKKIVSWISENIFLLLTIFLLAFIPLFPKLPLIDIKNTWVYIRAEDFFVAVGMLVWFLQLIRGKVSLKTPLTLPIMIFWIFGAIATIHAVLIIFPEIPNVFANVAFLSFLRRVEYISLFFIAFSAMRDKKLIPLVVGILVITLFLVVGYGVGQRYLGFPAFLTMNEEYAKGVPIFLSELSRVPSTFAGHYDLAAYLVLIIPILVSMIFGFRNWFVRLVLVLAVASGFVLLYMTVSRSSFFVLPVALLIVLYFHMRRVLLFLLPVAGMVLIFLSLNFSNTLLDRFGSTVSEVDVLVDARSGEPIGHVQEVVISDYGDKPVVRREFSARSDLNVSERDPNFASSSAIVQRIKLPLKGIAIVPPDTPTGENLPQGTGYVNLTLSPVNKRLPAFFYDSERFDVSSESAYVTMFEGNFLVKRALAYDLSFTTRFQGEWPHAIEAFKRNILFGSGYSSISLAVDNNFLRILGEVGLLGLLSFVGIFLVAGVYIRKTWADIDSIVVKSFIIGFAAGVTGLFLNAVLIDVFEASKIAYLLWLLMGVTVGIVHLYQAKQISLFNEFKKAVTSQYAVFVYIATITFVVFWQMIGNYFIGDDFTWLRWAADCSQFGTDSCPSLVQRISHYFTQTDGFFYRPGTKLYFALMYSLSWLNQELYHIVSIVLHVIVSMLLFLLIRKVSKDTIFAACSIFIFLLLSGYTEAIYWIAATGHLINAALILCSVLFFIAWDERKNILYFFLAFIAFVLSLLFHELGVITPLLILAYKFVTDDKFKIRNMLGKVHYPLFLLPLFWYLIVRFFAQSHWSGGDYSYNIVKLPFNFLGNAISYFFLGVFGPISLSFSQSFRTAFAGQLVLVAVVFVVSLSIVMYLIIKRNFLRKLRNAYDRISDDKKSYTFALLFFVITLLPFLGLGNITSRYSYLASAGVAMFIVLLLKKLYGYLLRNGIDIARAATTILILIFCLFHIMQTQKVFSDWREAGVRTERFITSIDAMYEDSWATQNVTFYFVNVPIRVGDAWMFPVGLEDALWFVFRNPNLVVNSEQSIREALSKVEQFYTKRVFEFKDDGSVVNVRKTRTGVPIYDQ